MHLTDSQIASYPEYTQESTGGGSYDNFPDINESPTQRHPNAPLRLGQVIFDRDGKGYIYAKATAAFTKGQLATPSANTTGAVQTADATGDNIHVVKTNFSGLTLNGEKGNWLLFAAAGLATVWRRIKGNSATAAGVAYVTISRKATVEGQRGYDADAPASAIAGTTVVHIYRPGHVGVCGANGYAVGVARNTVDSGNCSLFGMHGLHLVSCTPGSDALTDNALAIPGAAGVAKGVTAGGITAAEAAAVIGIAKFPISSGTGVLTPILLNLMGRLA